MRKNHLVIEDNRLICEQRRFTKRCRPIKEIAELTVDQCPTMLWRPRSPVFQSVIMSIILISVGILLIKNGVGFGAVLLLLLGIVAINMLIVLILHAHTRRGLPSSAVACITIRFRDKSVFEGYITEEDIVRKIEQKMS